MTEREKIDSSERRFKNWRTPMDDKIEGILDAIVDGKVSPGYHGASDLEVQLQHEYVEGRRAVGRKLIAKLITARVVEELEELKATISATQLKVDATEKQTVRNNLEWVKATIDQRLAPLQKGDRS